MTEITPITPDITQIPKLRRKADTMLALLRRRESIAGKLKELEDAKRETDSEIMALLFSAGLRACAVGNCRISHIEGERSTINRDYLMAALLSYGMPADKILPLIARSSKVAVYSYIRVDDLRKEKSNA